MRALGRTLGLRASSLYHHFPDRNAIEEALGSKASGSLLLALKSACLGLIGGPRIHALAEAYIDFALNNQALYNLVTTLPRSDENKPEGKALRDFFLETLNGDTSAAGALWAFLHGYASLHSSGRFDTTNATEVFERGLSAIVTDLVKKKNIL